MRVAIAEDDEASCKLLQAYLKTYSEKTGVVFEIDCFPDGMKLVNAYKPVYDLLLLDINLPDADGFYICKELRRRSDIPIVIVTSRDTEMDELMSMNLGADDFITKPYHAQILLARIASVLRRAQRGGGMDAIPCGRFLLNLGKGCLEYGGRETELTKNECKILTCLAERRGRIVSRDELMRRLWDSDIYVDDNTLTVNINRLRRKLEDAGLEGVIETKRGLGYLLQ